MLPCECLEVTRGVELEDAMFVRHNFANFSGINTTKADDGKRRHAQSSHPDLVIQQVRLRDGDTNTT